MTQNTVKVKQTSRQARWLRRVSHVGAPRSIDHLGEFMIVDPRVNCR
jgi:hypothetical protein